MNVFAGDIEQMQPRPISQQGFTLLELLVVISILAAISFTTATVFQGIDEEVDAQLTQVELVEVAKAVRRFRADTGYFPKEGAFDLGESAITAGDCRDLYTVLTGSSTGHPAAGIEVNNADFFPSYAPASCEERVVWFYNAANLSQLTGVGTFKDGMSGVMDWDAAAARGWRGPYLDASAEGYVDMGSADSTAWTPIAGSVYADIPAVFTGSPERPLGAYYVSRRVPSDNAGYIAGDVSDLEWSGRPILMFVEKNGVVAEKVILVSMGANGALDSNLGQLDTCIPGGDDQVICIYAD